MHNKTAGKNSPGLSRRRFLQLGLAGASSFSLGIWPAIPGRYRVGIGNNENPYVATFRAVKASGQWPSEAIQGNTVLIKPNLVAPITAESGVTTDPEVVRAVVDLCLHGGARQVCLIEGGPRGANFSACDYDFFYDYDPHGRIALMDISREPEVLADVPSGAIAYKQIFCPEMVLSPDAVFITVGKLKTHLYTHATLASKNLVGLPVIEHYRIEPEKRCYAMHRRGIDQAISDLNLLRPTHFALVDGVCGMEGDGPAYGDPVKMDMVVAGKNSCAVDRVCLETMGLPQRGVQHLAYMARLGLGPKSLDEIDIVGDAINTRNFRWPADLSPVIEYPRAMPNVFTPGSGNVTQIVYWVAGFPCYTKASIVLASDFSPEITHVRTIRDWEHRTSGLDVLTWDGRDDSGLLVDSGSYCIQIQAKYRDEGTIDYTTGWLRVEG